MIDFKTYVLYQIVSSIVGVVVLLPLAVWWLNYRKKQREKKRRE